LKNTAGPAFDKSNHLATNCAFILLIFSLEYIDCAFLSSSQAAFKLLAALAKLVFNPVNLSLIFAATSGNWVNLACHSAKFVLNVSVSQVLSNAA